MVFKPKHGAQARWRILYEEFATAKVGDVVTYEALAEALDLHPKRDRHLIQMAVRRAAETLEEENCHALASVTNVGYRIVEPSEHLTLARRHQARAGRSLMRGQSKVVNVDLNGVGPEMRHTFEVVARAFALQMDFNRRFSMRQEELDRAIEEVSNKSEQEINELRERLDRLERNTQ